MNFCRSSTPSLVTSTRSSLGWMIVVRRRVKVGSFSRAAHLRASSSWSSIVEPLLLEKWLLLLLANNSPKLLLRLLDNVSIFLGRIWGIGQEEKGLFIYAFWFGSRRKKFGKQKESVRNIRAEWVRARTCVLINSVLLKKIILPNLAK